MYDVCRKDLPYSVEWLCWHTVLPKHESYALEMPTKLNGISGVRIYIPLIAIGSFERNAVPLPDPVKYPTNYVGE